MLAEQENITTNDIDNSRLVISTAMLQNVLDDIVPVLVLYQSFRVFVKFVENRRCLLDGTVFQNTLDDTATVRMGR